MSNTTLSNPIDIRFVELRTRYLTTGELFTPKDILGERPIIPDSPDMDARLEAYEECAEYSRQYQALEEKIKQMIKEKA